MKQSSHHDRNIYGHEIYYICIIAFQHSIHACLTPYLYFQVEILDARTKQQLCFMDKVKLPYASLNTVGATYSPCGHILPCNFPGVNVWEINRDFPDPARSNRAAVEKYSIKSVLILYACLCNTTAGH